MRVRPAKNPASGRVFCFVRPAWAHSCGCKSCRELVTANEAKRNCTRATGCREEAWTSGTASAAAWMKVTLMPSASLVVRECTCFAFGVVGWRGSFVVLLAVVLHVGWCGRGLKFVANIGLDRTDHNLSAS